MSPSSQKPRVLLTGEIDWAHDEWDALSDVATLEIADSKDREAFIKDLKGKYNGVFAIYRTFGSVNVSLETLPQLIH
jgi:glyoxylate reductase